MKVLCLKVELVLTTLSTFWKFNSVVPNLRVRPLSKGHLINPRGHEMINGGERKENKVLPQKFVSILQTFL